MNEDRLMGVRQTLETELQRVEDEVTRLKADLAEAEAERKPLAAALTALGKKKPAKPSKPAPKKDQVLAIATELLEANGPMPSDDLVSLIKERLTEAGMSHNGLGLRVAETMNDAQFESQDGRIGLSA